MQPADPAQPPAWNQLMTAAGVGTCLPRKEDYRLLRNRGQYVADIKLPGMRDIAFVRSPVATDRDRCRD